MSEAKHTLGPWRLNSVGPIRFIIDGTKEGWVVADLKTYHGRHTVEDMEANAHLIAAAPELLDALQHLSDVYEHIWVKMSDGEMAIVRGAWEVAAAAIAKAEGRS
ncbi:hypothetical protein RHSP_31677 [Rhizobium freirei PRF 81]|uniref:Uncharacterized protein n=1 Tax=Rhizobium freirei PRF 81 TaxID=363754 RepID=N6UZ85_9HYPH|nr:hypothetical protein [Rhizobium freirei]ENN86031.1 hypothetical protein RHSP_31677 [Rhizobium freirei PRF 81]